MLPGGPGAGIAEMVGGDKREVQHVADFQQQYDVVTLDPRGVGKSSPIRCDPKAAPKVEMPLDHKPTQAEFNAVAHANAAFIKSCADATRRAVLASLRQVHRPGHRAHAPGAVAQQRPHGLWRLVRLGLRRCLSRSLSEARKGVGSRRDSRPYRRVPDVHRAQRHGACRTPSSAWSNGARKRPNARCMARISAPPLIRPSPASPRCVLWCRRCWPGRGPAFRLADGDADAGRSGQRRRKQDAEGNRQGVGPQHQRRSRAALRQGRP